MFSDFRVHNPASGNAYQVAIRGRALGQNLCSCPDFATNDLGTCKHIEFTLARLESRRGGKAALAKGAALDYSEIWLDHAGMRQIRFRASQGCPPALLARAADLFDASAGGALPWRRFDELDALLRDAQASGHALRCRDDVWQFVAQIRDGEHRHAALAKAYLKAANDKALVRLLKRDVRPNTIFSDRAQGRRPMWPVAAPVGLKLFDAEIDWAVGAR